jgi:hypothetical protein
MRYSDSQVCQDSFTMTKRDVRVLGSDRAERNPMQFCATFGGIAEVLYCGLLDNVPEHSASGSCNGAPLLGDGVPEKLLHSP